MMNVRFAACAVLLISLSACTSEPLEFADWTIPVPEGTRIIEYAAVPIEDRTERIELVEDLVIRELGDDPNYAFYHPIHVAVDDAGRLYVTDAREARVQVFNRHGEYLRTLGKKGQGPGEFTVPYSAAIAGDYLVVSDPSAFRLSSWGLDGQHLGDRRLMMNQLIQAPMFGTEDGSIIAHYVRRVGESASQIIGRFSTDGDEQLRLGEFKEPPRLYVITGPISFWETFDDMSGSAGYAATATGLSYVTAGDEYQVLALDPQGQARWALRVAWKRFLVSEEDKLAHVGRMSRVPTDIDLSETDWPELFGSVSRLDIDGRGRLYVFPHVSLAASPPGGNLPVDIYSADGKLLFSGMIEPFEWTAALGDFVYGIRENQETGEREPVRYRLVEPF